MKMTDPFRAVPDVRDGLVGDWNLGEDINQVVDLTPNGNHGVITGASRVKDDVLGGKNVLSFDGINDKIDISNNAAFSIVDEITCEILFKPEDYLKDGWQVLFKKWHNGNSWHLTIDQAHKLSIYIHTSAGDFHTEIDLLNDEKWFHVFYTYDRISEKLILYSNGQNVSEIAANGTLNVSVAGINLGLSGASLYPFLGSIAMARIYNLSLSPEQIEMRYKFIHKKYGVLEGFND